MYYIIPYKLDINWLNLQIECVILITYIICCKCSDNIIGLDCICLTTTHVLQDILAVIWDSVDRTLHILINIMVHTYTCLRDKTMRGQFIWEGFLMTNFEFYNSTNVWHRYYKDNHPLAQVSRRRDSYFSRIPLTSEMHNPLHDRPWVSAIIHLYHCFIFV